MTPQLITEGSATMNKKSLHDKPILALIKKKTYFFVVFRYLSTGNLQTFVVLFEVNSKSKSGDGRSSEGRGYGNTKHSFFEVKYYVLCQNRWKEMHFFGVSDFTPSKLIVIMLYFFRLCLNSQTSYSVEKKCQQNLEHLFGEEECLSPRKKHQ